VSIRVLIADDHILIRKGIRTVLSLEGIEVCGEAENGSEAVNKTLQSRPDLVILDLTMPVMGGFEAARKIQKTAPEIPILFYSMHDSTQLIKEIKRVGVQGYVSKSKVTDVLLEAVNALVIQKTTFFPELSAASSSVSLHFPSSLVSTHQEESGLAHVET
jgi:DNA-binding NarL/FixJ family response regulator